MSSDASPLACPSCARKHSLDERFCVDCGMPLVYVGRGEEQPITGSHERARKVKPQYVGGELVKVAYASNLAEAELIQGMLLEEGVPSVQRRSRGFDVPDFLAAGPRDILVPQAAHDAARELLANLSGTGEHPVPEDATPSATAENPLRLLLGMLAALAVALLVIYLLFEVL